MITFDTATDLPLAADPTTMNGTTNGATSGTTNGTTDGATNGTRSHSQHSHSNGTTKRPMAISGIGSILAMHFPPSFPHLQSLFYHHMLSKNIYLAERGFISLNIELGTQDVEKFAEATGDFVDKYRNMILAC